MMLKHLLPFICLQFKYHIVDPASGVEMPFRQTFEWRPVGAAAIRKRKRKSGHSNFQLQIQGNRLLDWRQ